MRFSDVCHGGQHTIDQLLAAFAAFGATPDDARAICELVRITCRNLVQCQPFKNAERSLAQSRLGNHLEPEPRSERCGRQPCTRLPT